MKRGAGKHAERHIEVDRELFADAHVYVHAALGLQLPKLHKLREHEIEDSDGRDQRHHGAGEGSHAHIIQRFGVGVERPQERRHRRCPPATDSDSVAVDTTRSVCSNASRAHSTLCKGRRVLWALPPSSLSLSRAHARPVLPPPPPSLELREPSAPSAAPQCLWDHGSAGAPAAPGRPQSANPRVTTRLRCCCVCDRQPSRKKPAELVASIP